MPEGERILLFWFGVLDEDGHADPTHQESWFEKNDDFDAEIRSEFLADVVAALDGRLEHWRANPQSCLAYVILLDQFTRNIFRNTPEAFGGDPQALSAAQQAVDRGFATELPADHRRFIYMPFMHSEELSVQDRSVALFRAMREAGRRGHREAEDFALDTALRHRTIVKRFGRFPHRNKVLGRTSSPEEIAFLTEPGSSF